MPTPLEIATHYRDELLKQDAAALGRLARAYHNSFKMLADKLELLIKEATEQGFTAGQLQRAERYQALMTQVANQLRDLQGLTQTEINQMGNLAIRLGINHANGLTAAIAGNEQLAIYFNRLNPEVVKSLLGFLEPDSNLFKRLGKLSEVATQRIADDFITGVTAGWNPVKISRIFLNDWGMALTDSMRMTRTAQLYAYREANRATFIANSDVVDGWYWCCDLSSETCAACLAMDGTWHSNDETLDDHYNGRCSMLPAVRGFDSIIEEGRGQSWFEAQPESTQRVTLGKSKWEAWKAGKFEFNQLAAERADDVYGKMYAEVPLKDLVGEEE